MRQHIQTRRTEGFTLIETMISLLLVAGALVMAARVVMFTLDAQKKSQARFTLLLKMESHKNRLIAGSYDSKDLEPGQHNLEEGLCAFTLTISQLSPTLKKITLAGTHKKYRVVAYTIHFYKSKIIKENSHD